MADYIIDKIEYGSNIYNLQDNISGYTKNTGTVTSVGITEGTGISVSGSPITSSGSITVGHSNSVTAQSTQEVYPIKIDAQGHISAYGSAKKIPRLYVDSYTVTNTSAISSGSTADYKATLTYPSGYDAALAIRGIRTNHENMMVPTAFSIYQNSTYDNKFDLYCRIRAMGAVAANSTVTFYYALATNDY